MSLQTRCKILAAFAAVLLGACGRPDTPASGAVKPVLPAEHRFEIDVGGATVRMRLAVFPHEQQRGLMFVREMPEDEGMLFLHETGRSVSFWMRNTFIPLDIGFFDESGVLREVHPMYPHVEDPVVSVASDIRYALEMNRGWYARHGVGPGAQLDRGALAAALAARGLEPKRFVEPG